MRHLFELGTMSERILVGVRFYRCIRHEAPSEDDFVSNDSRGRPCIDDDLKPLWTGYFLSGN